MEVRWDPDPCRANKLVTGGASGGTGRADGVAVLACELPELGNA